ncbi:MAG: cupin domain-containing protein [Trueperaceae bacterium]|nr:cupin domain-containing protein [Trueperaceae bacterium]
MNQKAEAYVYQAGESELRWMGETSTYFLAAGALTGEAFGLVDETALYGESVPLHRHNDIESFYVLEGEITFYLGNQPRKRAGVGTFVHIPGATIHGFRIESEVARYLILTTPPHAEFYQAITLPSAHAVVEGAVIKEACQKYGVKFCGPLLG